MAGEAAPALVLETPKDPHAAARSGCYALLAEAFGYPTGTALERLLDGTLLTQLRDTVTSLGDAVSCPATLALPGGAAAATEIQILYTGLFEVATGRPAVSLFERRYGDGSQPEQKLWEDLFRFYKYFGIDFSAGGTTGEGPDHLLTELEFMHYLSFLEAGAENNQADLRRGQRDFLATHLARWTDGFAAALGTQDSAGPYLDLGRMLAAFVARDLMELEQSREA